MATEGKGPLLYHSPARPACLNGTVTGGAPLVASSAQEPVRTHESGGAGQRGDGLEAATGDGFRSECT